MSGKDGGYRLPDVIDPPRVCYQLFIPDEPFHKAAFWGALQGLASWYNWQRDPLRRGREVAGVWEEVLYDARQLNENGAACMAITDIRVQECILQVEYNNSGVWVTLGDLTSCAPPIPPQTQVRLQDCHIEQSFDDGETWQDVGDVAACAPVAVADVSIGEDCILYLENTEGTIIARQNLDMLECLVPEVPPQTLVRLQDCELQQTLDSGDTWATVGNIADCVPDPEPQTQVRTFDCRVQQSFDGGENWVDAGGFDGCFMPYGGLRVQDCQLQYAAPDPVQWVDIEGAAWYPLDGACPASFFYSRGEDTHVRGNSPAGNPLWRLGQSGTINQMLNNNRMFSLRHGTNDNQRMNFFTDGMVYLAQGSDNQPTGTTLARLWVSGHNSAYHVMRVEGRTGQSVPIMVIGTHNTHSQDPLRVDRGGTAPGVGNITRVTNDGDVHLEKNIVFRDYAGSNNNTQTASIETLRETPAAAQYHGEIRLHTQDFIGKKTIMRGSSTTDGTLPTIGVLGAVPVPRQTIPDITNESAAVQALAEALRDFGWITIESDPPERPPITWRRLWNFSAGSFTESIQGSNAVWFSGQGWRADTGNSLDIGTSYGTTQICFGVSVYGGLSDVNVQVFVNGGSTVVYSDTLNNVGSNDQVVTVDIWALNDYEAAGDYFVRASTLSFDPLVKPQISQLGQDGIGLVEPPSGNPSTDVCV